MLMKFRKLGELQNKLASGNSNAPQSDDTGDDLKQLLDTKTIGLYTRYVDKILIIYNTHRTTAETKYIIPITPLLKQSTTT